MIDEASGGAKTVQPHRPIAPGRYPDAPALKEDSRNLFTLPYVQLIEVLSDIFYPPNRLKDRFGTERVIVASALRVERYILFRAAWQPSFATEVQRALLDLTMAARARHNEHFANLNAADQVALLEAMELERLAPGEWPSPRNSAEQFAVLFKSISEGMFAEPGYGGNRDGLGWAYSSFITS